MKEMLLMVKYPNIGTKVKKIEELVTGVSIFRDGNHQVSIIFAEQKLDNFVHLSKPLVQITSIINPRITVLYKGKERHVTVHVSDVYQGRGFHNGEKIEFTYSWLALVLDLKFLQLFALLPVLLKLGLPSYLVVAAKRKINE